MCLLCRCAHLFICGLWSPAGKGLTSLMINEMTLILKYVHFQFLDSFYHRHSDLIVKNNVAWKIFCIMHFIASISMWFSLEIQGKRCKDFFSR